MNQLPVLVVGQGVAGSVLAWTLWQRGVPVRVVAAPQLPTASGVAAGIVNPLTGRKLVKTWAADQLFPYLHPFYTATAQTLATPFFTPLDLYRPYRDEAEQARYQTIAAQPDLARYLGEAAGPGACGAVVNDPLGGLRITQSGWVDLPAFTQAMRTYFIDRQLFTEALVQPQDVQVRADSVAYAGQTYQRVIFCEGPHGPQNPFFGFLPYSLVKGEILTAEVAHQSLQMIVNQGVFVMPISPTRIRIGATYAWDNLDWQPTEAGRSFLETKACALLRVPFRVVTQQAGLRPATQDRRPFVGWHPAHPAVGIFGGMGTKGVSLAPYLAHQLADAWLLGKEIDPAVNISRFYSLWKSDLNGAVSR